MQVMGQRPCPCHIELPWCKQTERKHAWEPSDAAPWLPSAPCWLPFKHVHGPAGWSPGGLCNPGNLGSCSPSRPPFPLIKGRTMRLNRPWSSKNWVVTFHSDLCAPLKYPSLGGRKPSVSFWRRCCGQGLLILYCQVVT